jgi:hypothetical protein
MTSVTEEEIMAYVDGELDEAARGRVTLAALADLDLADRIAQQRALRERLQAHFAPVTEEPVPAAWVESIRQATGGTKGGAQIVSLAAVRAEKAPPRRRWPAWAPAGAAMAACLAIGVFVGAQWREGDNSSPFVSRSGALVASGDLRKALDTQLASAQDGAPVRMLGTFHRQGGDLCRAFAGAQASGIACREGGLWQMQHVLPGSRQAASAYRQAGSSDAELMGIAQGMSVGDPLDAAQERAAQARGWR